MDLAQLLRVLRMHWIAIVAFTLFGGFAGYGWSLLQTPVYSADATGTVASAQASTDVGTALAFENLAKAKVKSYLELADSRDVAEFAIEKLDLKTTPELLVKKVTVTNPDDTAVIHVVAKGNSPETASKLATAWLEGMAKEVLAQAGVDDSSGELPVLQLRVSESAALPTQPSFPNVRLAVAGGLLGGVTLGIAFAVLKNLLDKRVRSVEQVEREIGVSVIGTVPIDKSLVSSDKVSFADDPKRSHAPLFEAMRELRTNIQFMNVDDPPQVLIVSSPLPGDGKSTVTANLAATIAATDRRVIVVDADLRKPTIAKKFGLVEGVGLTDVLVGEAELVDVLQPWGSSGNLLVMGAGQTPPNPSELLGSNAMKHILDELSDAAFVLVDAPPLIPVTDAAILAARTDGILVVASANKTTVDALNKAVHNLDRVGTKPAGIVLNKVPLKGPHAAGYGYGYGYGSIPTGPESNTSPDAGRRSESAGNSFERSTVDFEAGGYSRE